MGSSPRLGAPDSISLSPRPWPSGLEFAFSWGSLAVVSAACKVDRS